MLSTYTVAMKIFAIRGIEKRSIEEFKEIYELPWINIYKKLGVDIEMDEEYALWRKLSPKYEKLVVPIAGAKETLKKLKEMGVKTIILSSRDASLVLTEVKNHGFADLIDSVVAGVHDKKEVIHELLVSHEIEKENALYVGDMPHDIDTAKHAGIKSVAVLSGFGKKEELKVEKPDFMIEDISELIKLVKQN
ncbi:MAG: HAD family hydrolase [Candidatus Diapherotrites archaeon]|jgi:phosphoglycolate phosphatase|uniref:HAD family hydrolase n=1 Tax=Candidatus Iainarchaeum sp. TaxID=3101447 RepID=A0A8T5GGV0_9ARCH|nr:HAD family hydrolase [Candidatus Diapherotrites archaeon]